MKTNLVKVAAALLTSSAVSAYAASAGAGGEEAGLLIWALIGFAVLQAIPAMVMLYAMVKGVLAPADTAAVLPKA